MFALKPLNEHLLLCRYFKITVNKNITFLLIITKSEPKRYKNESSLLIARILLEGWETLLQNNGRNIILFHFSFAKCLILSRLILSRILRYNIQVRIIISGSLKIFLYLIWAEDWSELFWSKFVRCPSTVVVVVVIVVVKTFHIFIFSSRTTGPISTKLGTKHPWVKRIKVSSNEGPHHFQRGDNYEIAKIYQWYLKIFSRTTGANFNQTLRLDNYEFAKTHWRNSKKSSPPEPLANFNQT